MQTHPQSRRAFLVALELVGISKSVADAQPAIVSPAGSLSSTVGMAHTLVVSELAPDISLRGPPVPPWVQRQNVVSSKGSKKTRKKIYVHVDISLHQQRNLGLVDS